ncbi:MAG TPA: LuxR family transcriptional regulator [Allosphingosinicella sp.]
MRRLADRFADRAASCATLQNLRSALKDACPQLGFDFFALLHHSSLEGPDRGLVRIDNYPPEWVDELLGKGLAADDPVHLASRGASTGFAWTELGSMIALSRRHHSILSRSRRFGLGDGFTVPVNVPGEPSGSCSFAVRAGRGLPARKLMCAELVGSHAFRAARRIHDLPRRTARPHLSRRELQCLRLIALGKTDIEIALILGIAHETARQYVKRARAAYDVVSRSQLVVHALSDQWLELDELVPRRRREGPGANR